MSRGLIVSNLHVSVEGTEILKGIDLAVEPGRVYALMGPNGSGKSTLAFALAGHPHYEITAGTATVDGEDVLALSPDKRAKLGLFLSFQYPSAIPGVSVANFLRSARQAVKPSDDLTPKKFRDLVFEQLEVLGIDRAFLGRYVNDGFSGGEKKRLEMLQLAILQPKYAILDETDSGLDVDALRAVGDAIQRLRQSAGKDSGFLIITHYPRILQYVTPDVVHVMMEGRIVKTGGEDLAHRIEAEGYDKIRDEVGATSGAA